MLSQESEGRCVGVALKFKYRPNASATLASAALAELRANAVRFGPFQMDWAWASEEHPPVLGAQLCFANPRDASRAQGGLFGRAVSSKAACRRLARLTNALAPAFHARRPGRSEIC
jgi:hypothetical protein